MCSCKNGALVANYCNYKLNRDVEKHPGSSIYVDPNETTVAPLVKVSSYFLDRMQDNNVL